MVLPGWLKPPAWMDQSGADTGERQKQAISRESPIFLREVANWDMRWQRMLFQILVPPTLLVEYHIDPIKLTDAEGRPVIFTRVGTDRSSFRLELFHSGDSVEPMAEIELSDTAFNQIEVLWVSLQDPTAPRFDIDVLPSGETTSRGTASRNLSAEAAAKAAGLTPGQVRRGLHSLRWLAERLETLMLCLNQRDYIVQPLYYHTAVLFEQYGFAYIQGQGRMEFIHQGFASGGELRARLDGATPFRQPEQAGSIRGRSWAIHDGILDCSWDRVRMVKRIGVNAGVNTCPNIPW